MDNRTKHYIILSSIISVSLVIVSIMKHLEIAMINNSVNNLLTLVFFIPIIILLVLLSRDARIKKFWRVVFTMLSFFISLCVLVSMFIPLGALAMNLDNTDSKVEIDIPSDFNFSKSDICLDHAYFTQVAAREDGMFVICSPHIDERPYSEETFQKHYLDIYNSDGSFNKSLSFTSKQPYVVAITDTAINIYFYSYVVFYDINLDELHCYDIVDDYIQSDKYDHLRESEFTSGQWNYICSNPVIGGYRKLTRQSADVTQIIVNMRGMRIDNLVNILVIGSITGICCVILVAVIKHYKKVKYKKDLP